MLLFVVHGSLLRSEYRQTCDISEVAGMLTPSPSQGTRNDSAGTKSAGSKTAAAAYSPSYQSPETGRRQIRGVAYEQQGMTPTISPPKNNSNEPKLIYLIRHGESVGQKTPRRIRETDKTLLDCGLSDCGIQQAVELGNSLSSVELVVCSPLMRALQTSLIAFGTKIPILCHYHLREIGSPIPENCPRRIEHILNDLRSQNLDTTCVDYTQLQPPNWPDSTNDVPNVIRSRDHIPNVFKWLASHRPEKVIAVVCHYHVIRAALRLDCGSLEPSLKPINCQPIACSLCPRTGQLSTTVG